MKISAMPVSGILCFLLILFFGFVYLAGEANAATLSRVSDRLSTSRPSASAPLASNQAANADQVIITDFSENIIFLASDSAVLRSDTGQTENTVTVASASAADTPAADQRTIFFAGNIANSHHTGTAVFTAISAMHEITFNVPGTIPSGVSPDGGSILLTFPALATGDANNPASPSASTFQFNGLSSTQIKITDDGTEITPVITVTNPTTTVAGTILFNIDDGEISATSTIRIFLGCTAIPANPNGTSCTTHSPRIINPTQGTTALGTAITRTLQIDTRDTSDVGIDTAKIRIGTLDAVLVQGTVDPSLTVTIAALNSPTNLNTVTGCASEVPTSPGVASTATSVNLGALGGGITLAAQTITVSTNANFGYTITATSSGRFINPASGFYLPGVNGENLTANDTPAPGTIVAGTAEFGLFPCGDRVPDDGDTPDYDDQLTLSGGAKGTNPWNIEVNGFYATIANHTAAVSSDVTALRYGATVSETTPAGTYRTYFTYVVTATF